MGYQTVEDPSIFLRLPIVDSPDRDVVGAALVVWTTTPWTLPSNTGVAVSAATHYVLVDVDGERLIVAAALAERVFGEGHQARRTIEGSMLVGVALRAAVPERRWSTRGRRRRLRLHGGGDGHRAHGPRVRAQDLAVGRAQGWPVFKPVGDDGRFTGLAPSSSEGCS